MERAYAFSERLARYHLNILEIGGRSSMSKTDKDASFMRMKDGHMMNGQLKPGYSIQLAIDGEYIVGTNVSTNANDTAEMIPMLEKIDEIGIKYSNIVDDAGYDSEENTAWLEKRGFKCYIKPQNYAKKQKRSFKKKIGERENMAYSAELDEYTCANGRALKAVRTGARTSHSGYKSMIAYYQCESCENCGYKGKGAGKRSNAQGDRAMGVSKELARLRKISETSAASPSGIVFRINRRIQAEGAFSAMRVWLGLERLSTWGAQGARAQAALLRSHSMLESFTRKSKTTGSERSFTKRLSDCANHCICNMIARIAPWRVIGAISCAYDADKIVNLTKFH